MREALNVLLNNVKKEMSACPWENPYAYADFLAQTYYYVCHSTRLLGLAAGLCRVDRDLLHRRFVQHIGEEKLHERLALNDLRGLGLKLEDFPERSITKAFYEAQYYKIERLDPTALFGYILLLEGVAVSLCPEIYQRIARAHGKQCANFLRVHVEEDVDHLPKAFAQIEGLSASQKNDIMINMAQTADLYGKIIAQAAQSPSVDARARAA
ncbi:iron-containing redox enzyme family protein [Methylocystis sp. MJC1]|jgi:uncharacterized ferritin-like protein (DUF455 family)|uniref:iron-containing redox enzyme family protein n=1 Tax=Methylocystis sp. MJC1 TaxID=2654282 RepID=UPI0013EE01D6|nr:iron-containing redox enzyme family protein [Methylocystis sp. MJC1]KAF2991256.1 hypothetical protein MJC1_01605 [Methylocystis sp. MJC1]MBU6526205.1 iron-containing redox enzyme family protein [Methylocystis sp. MJC1]UZX12659.1 iron-containing redox enzyme family protein [Methylocystis sp. MJC1]